MTDHASETPSALPLVAVAVTLVLWASAFVAIRHLGPDFSPVTLTLGRTLVASVCLGIACLATGFVRPTGRQWLSIVTIGALWFGVYNVALNEGERHVDAGTAAMLIQLSPILIAVLAALFLGERFTPWLGAGLAVAFGGVALIATAGPSEGGRDLLGVALCLLSALVYSISLILQKPLVARLPAVQITWLACSVAAVLTLPFAPRLLGEIREAPASSTLWLVYLGLFPTAIAFTTYAFALRHMSASSLGVTTYLVPPITIVMGLVFLGEAPQGLAYVGGLLALVGVWLARRQPKVLAPPAEAPTQVR